MTVYALKSPLISAWMTGTVQGGTGQGLAQNQHQSS